MHTSVIRTAAIASVAFITATASAQLVADGDPVTFVQTSTGFTANELAGGEVATTFDDGTDTMGLTGDAFVTHLSGDFASGLQFIGMQTFESLDGLPVEITPTLFADFKVVNGGGPAEGVEPTTSIDYALAIYETGGFDPALPNFLSEFSLLGPAVYVVGSAVGETNLEGNGFLVIDETIDGDSYVLSSGISYTAVLSITTVTDATELGSTDGTASTFIEAGGISEFAGLSAMLNARNVPEPATLGLAVFAPMLLGRRRR